MREHMESLGVVTSIDIHLEDAGQVTYQVHPVQRQAVMALETTAASVALYASAQNPGPDAPHRRRYKASLAAGSTEPGWSLALVERVA